MFLQTQSKQFTYIKLKELTGLFMLLNYKNEPGSLFRAAQENSVIEQEFLNAFLRLMEQLLQSPRFITTIFNRHELHRLRVSDFLGSLLLFIDMEIRAAPADRDMTLERHVKEQLMNLLLNPTLSLEQRARLYERFICDTIDGRGRPYDSKLLLELLTAELPGVPFDLNRTVLGDRLITQILKALEAENDPTRSGECFPLYAQIIRRVLELGFRLHGVDAKGPYVKRNCAFASPLHLAAQLGFYPGISLFTDGEDGIDVDDAHPGWTSTPLYSCKIFITHYSNQANHYKNIWLCAQALLARGASLTPENAHFGSLVEEFLLRPICPISPQEFGNAISGCYGKEIAIKNAEVYFKECSLTDDQQALVQEAFTVARSRTFTLETQCEAEPEAPSIVALQSRYALRSAPYRACVVTMLALSRHVQEDCARHPLYGVPRLPRELLFLVFDFLTQYYDFRDWGKVPVHVSTLFPARPICAADSTSRIEVLPDPAPGGAQGSDAESELQNLCA